MLLNLRPSGSWPEASIAAVDASIARQRPVGSKFSIANPTGSIMLWQPAHVGLARCAAMRSRIDKGFADPAPPSFSSSIGTLGGGGGGSTPRMLLRIHLPRFTGDVRIAKDVVVRMLAWPSSPPRGLSRFRLTRRKWLPLTLGMP